MQPRPLKWELQEWDLVGPAGLANIEKIQPVLCYAQWRRDRSIINEGLIKNTMLNYLKIQ